MTKCWFSSENFMASYLIFLLIKPPAEQYKFLSCKEMLRDSIAVLKSR